MKTVCLPFILVLLACSPGIAADRAPILHYTFDDGTAADASGTGNGGMVHGGEFVESPGGKALRFDGVDDFVECAMSESLKRLERAATFEMWIKPDALQGGLVGIHSGAERKGQRLVMAFDTQGESPGLKLTTSDGSGIKKHARDHGLDPPVEGVWNHLALTYDGNTIAQYLDGRLVKIRAQQRGQPEVADLPLWIGRCVGHGEAFYRGEIDEVRIFDRALESETVVEHYRADAAAHGKDASLFTKPVIKPYVLPEPGWITTEVDVGLLRPLPEGSRIRASLVDGEGTETGAGAERLLLPSEMVPAIKVAAGALGPGDYVLRVEIAGPREQAIGEPVEASIVWPGRAKAWENIRVFNNLVWELLNEVPGAVDGQRIFTFSSPKTRWLRFGAEVDAGSGAVRVSVDPAGRRRAELVFEAGERATKYAMCFLPAGDARLIVQAEGSARVDRLVARSIPEIFHHKLLGGPKPIGLSPETIGFMKEHVLANINTFVGPLHHAAIQDNAPSSYRRLRSIHAKGTPDIGKPYFQSKDEAYEYITESDAIHNEFADGIIFDEFTGSSAQAAYYADAFDRIRSEEKYKDKLIYAYIATLHGDDNGRKFVQAIMDAGGSLVWERYLATRSSESAAREYLRQTLAKEANAYREKCPGSIDRLTPLFGYYTLAGGHLNNSTPTVNYLTYLDMQFNMVANHPVFWGTYGLGGYGSSYADEETTRWFMKLHRHYGIEGKTGPATNDPYRSGHIENPDFLYGTEGWSLDPAEAGSIRPGFRRGIGHLQARKARIEGSSFLVTRRSDKGPNRFSQEIKGLEPGRLYSFQMFTGDNESLSRIETHGVTIRFEGATVLPEKSYMYLVCNPPWGSYPPYSKENPAWMNYHYRVFRAESGTARLIVSDYGCDAAPAFIDIIGVDLPAGPIGQEIFYNFITVKPYYAAHWKSEESWYHESEQVAGVQHRAG